MTTTPLQRTPLKFGTNENEERLVREYFKNDLAEIQEDYEGFIQFFQDLKNLPKADCSSYDSLINISNKKLWQKLSKKLLIKKATQSTKPTCRP